MRLLVLGGSGFVGRAAVDEALRRDWTVTTLNRGLRGQAPAGVETLHGDRLAPGGLDALRGRKWDAVLDTWSSAPRAVLDSATLLAGSVGHYGYVSSRSVYRTPVALGSAEGAPVVDGAPDADGGGYAEVKAGAERALTSVFGDHALLARAGLILGPHEDTGRLPWWLLRSARGGPMLAPGPRDLPIQLIDVRDLVGWMLDQAVAGRGGAFNVVSKPGHATMGELLEACVEATGGRAELRWIEPGRILAAGVEPWNDLPVWVPPGHEYEALGLHSADTRRAYDAGLSCRPVGETVSDTWAWLSTLDHVPQREDRPGPGISPETEAAILAA
jgi:nucleoside-diphosphate-sugar epimerase